MWEWCLSSLINCSLSAHYNLIKGILSNISINNLIVITPQGTKREDKTPSDWRNINKIRSFFPDFRQWQWPPLSLFPVWKEGWERDEEWRWYKIQVREWVERKRLLHESASSTTALGRSPLKGKFKRSISWQSRKERVYWVVVRWWFLSLVIIIVKFREIDFVYLLNKLPFAIIFKMQFRISFLFLLTIGVICLLCVSPTSGKKLKKIKKELKKMPLIFMHKKKIYLVPCPFPLPIPYVVTNHTVQLTNLTLINCLCF